MPAERVQKILAQAGITSRRKAEELILEGSVTINGQPAKLGDKAEWGKDAIKVNGKLLTRPEEPIYVAFHKPRSVISMMEDPEGRPTLADYLSKIKSRLFPIGRLDFNSEGLILLTNDGGFGELVQRRDDIPRVYEVKVKGRPTEEMLDRIRRGAKVGGRFIKPHSVLVAETLTQKVKIEVVLMGAGALDLKALFEERGFLVDRVVRIAIGHLSIVGIAPGEFKILKTSQIEALLQQPELGLRWIEERASKRKPAHLMVAQPEGEEDAAAGTSRGPRKIQIRRGATSGSAGFGRSRTEAPRGSSRGPRRDDRSTAGGGEGRWGGGGDERPRSSRPPRFSEGRGDAKPRAPRFGEGRGPRRDDRFGEGRPPRRDDRSAGGGESRWGGGGEDRPRSSRPPRFSEGRGDAKPRSPRFGEGRGPRRDDRFGEGRPPRGGESRWGGGGEDRPRSSRPPRFSEGRDDAKPRAPRGPRPTGSGTRSGGFDRPRGPRSGGGGGRRGPRR
jgi:23S rRNA pseudouridine2605 synthase